MTTPLHPLRFGLIGVDSPHAPSFIELLGDGMTGTVTGGTIGAAWPGVAADDFPLARDRIDGFTERVRALGVPVLASLEAVAEDCDAILVVASDVRTHRGYVERAAVFGKPVYVDTRFALSLADAQAMLGCLDDAGALALAGSPKRFTPEFRAAAGGHIERADFTGPLPTQPGHPVLDWYGFHLVDLALAALGAGIATVDASSEHDPVLLTWEDGRTATLAASATTLTSGALYRADGSSQFSIVSGQPMLVGLLEALVQACRSGAPTTPRDQLVDVVAVIEAARASRSRTMPVQVQVHR